MLHVYASLSLSLSLPSSPSLPHHGSSVVGGGDGSEPLLASCVPDLQLDLLSFDLDSTNLKINSCKRTYKHLHLSTQHLYSGLPTEHIVYTVICVLVHYTRTLYVHVHAHVHVHVHAYDIDSTPYTLRNIHK